MQAKDNLPKVLPKKLSDYLTKVKADSFADVVTNNDSSLVRLKKDFGEKQIQTLVVGMINEINGFYNVSNRMSAVQMAETAKIIVEEFYPLTVSDLKLFTKYAKMGTFGECFRMDGSVIMRWLTDYFKIRMDRMEGICITESGQHKIEDKQPILGSGVPKEVDENMRKLFNKLKKEIYAGKTDIH